jgi:hypothetical protein
MTELEKRAEGLPENIVAERHDVSGKWVFHYLNDEQAEKVIAALKAKEWLEDAVIVLEEGAEPLEGDLCYVNGFENHSAQRKTCSLSTKNKGVNLVVQRASVTGSGFTVSQRFSSPQRKKRLSK